MTGPAGDRYRGWWRITSCDAPAELVFEDGFADETGAPDSTMPVTMTRVSLVPREGGGTAMVIESTFASAEAMERLVAMGVVEGLSAALAQTDALLTSPG